MIISFFFLLYFLIFIIGSIVLFVALRHHWNAWRNDKKSQANPEKV